MQKDLPKYIKYPLITTFIGLGLVQLPFVGVLLLLPLIPFTGLYDLLIPGQFGETGHHVEIGFAWIVFKTWNAWLFYGSFFFLVGLIFGLVKHRSNSSPRE